MQLKLISPIRILSVLAFVFYLLIAIVNHWNFNLTSENYGVPIAAMYDYAHFNWHDSLLLSDAGENYLATNFDCYLILLSPLGYIFGSYTLILFVAFAIVLGGTGVYRLMKEKSGEQIANYAAATYLFSFGVISSVGYGYYPYSIAANVLPWLLLAIHHSDKRKLIFYCIGICLGGPEISLVLGFILLGIYFQERKNKKQLNRLLLILAGSSMMFYAFINFLLQPGLFNPQIYHPFQYSGIGESGSDALRNIFAHPIDALTNLFVNHSGLEINNGIKTEFWIFFLLSGGVLLIIQPKYLILLFPILLQKLFHGDSGRWGINAADCILICMLIILYAFQWIGSAGVLKQRLKIVGITLLFLNLGLSFRMMDKATYHVRRDSIRIYHPMHYHTKFDKTSIIEAINMIPDNASVCCSNEFLSQLAWRDQIYAFPNNQLKAEYILLLLPDGQDSFPKEKVERVSMEHDVKINFLYNSNRIVLMKRQ